MKVELKPIGYLIENIQSLINVYRVDYNKNRTKSGNHSQRGDDYSARIYSNSAWFSSGKVEAMEYLLEYIKRNAHIYHD